METFITHEAPYWYLCAVDGPNQVWVRLKGSPEDVDLADAEQFLSRELGRWTNWQPNDSAGIIRLNPFGHFVVPESAHHVNSRHFSMRSRSKSGPLGRKTTQPWKGRNS